MKLVHCVLCLYLCILASDGIYSSLFIKYGQLVILDRENKVNHLIQSTNQPLEYKIIKVWNPIKNTGLRIGFAVINPEYLKAENAKVIADEMNKYFAAETQVRVYFWDNELDAKVYGEKKQMSFLGSIKT